MVVVVDNDRFDVFQLVDHVDPCPDAHDHHRCCDGIGEFGIGTKDGDAFYPGHRQTYAGVDGVAIPFSADQDKLLIVAGGGHGDQLRRRSEAEDDLVTGGNLERRGDLLQRVGHAGTGDDQQGRGFAQRMTAVLDRAALFRVQSGEIAGWRGVRSPIRLSAQVVEALLHPQPPDSPEAKHKA